MASFSDLTKQVDSLSSSLSKLADQARSTRAEMVSTTRASGAMTSSLAKAEERANATGQALRRVVEEVQREAAPRLADLVYDLEQMAAKGDNYAAQLLEHIRQVEQGALRADQIFSILGDATILFEGQTRKITDLLSELLPSVGEVQDRIRDLTEQLEGASIDALVDRLLKQYNVFARQLADVVKAFQEGRVSIERVLIIARQIQQLLPESETAALAKLIEEGLMTGELA